MRTSSNYPTRPSEDMPNPSMQDVWGFGIETRATEDARPENESRSAAQARLASGGAVVVARTDGHALLVSAAHITTTSTMAFMIRHTSGFVQVSLHPARCESLDVPPMDPFDGKSTRMCVGVDAVQGTTTGISASDRAATARALLDPDSQPKSFTRPGHLIPVSVNRHALRTVRTAAAVALHHVIDAELPPGAVFAELVGVVDPNSMMDFRESAEFAREHDLPLVVHRSRERCDGGRSVRSKTT